MRRILICSLLALSCFAFVAAPASADIVIRTPDGRLIVVPAPVNVQVGPPGVLVEAPFTKVIVNKAIPDVKKMDAAEPPLPPPTPLPDKNPPPVAKAAEVIGVIPSDFAKTFKPASIAATYEVTFQHPVSNSPVNVAFTLPSGSPTVTYNANALRFDYGQGREVELRFEAGGKVAVMQK